jgi:prephenate dehydratase
LQRKNKDEAVIASKRCAELYGLTILAENIQDIPHNFTRFVLFQNEKKPRPDFAQTGKLSLAFSVKHEPGALLHCLQAFADNNINLTRLQSRPIPSNPFAYLFHVDCLTNNDDQHFQACLAKMRHHATQLRVYGSYGPCPLPRWS